MRKKEKVPVPICALYNEQSPSSDSTAYGLGKKAQIIRMSESPHYFDPFSLDRLVNHTQIH